MLACLDYAARTGQHARVTALTAALAGLLRSDGPWAEAITRHQAASRGRAASRDRLGQANALLYLGAVRAETGDYPAAAQALERARLTGPTSAGTHQRGICACCLPASVVRAPIVLPGPGAPGAGKIVPAHPRPYGPGPERPGGPVAGDTGWVRVVVTEVGRDGSMRRRTLDTCGLTEAGRWETLVEQVLAFPPPYRAAPGSPVYAIHAGDRAVLVGEQDLTGPLRDLVITILAAGDLP